jgi:hypothetical protein
MQVNILFFRFGLPVGKMKMDEMMFGDDERDDFLQ